jgi:hypothetical protein
VAASAGVTCKTRHDRGRDRNLEEQPVEPVALGPRFDRLARHNHAALVHERARRGRPEQFVDDVAVEGLRGWVEEDDAVLTGPGFGAKGSPRRLGDEAVGLGGGRHEFAGHGVAGFRQARAAVDVVELVEEDGVPGPLEVGGGVGRRGAREGLQGLFGLDESALGPAHGHLDPALDGVAADGVVLEFALDDRQTVPRVGHRVEVGAGRREDEPRAGKVAAVGQEPLDLDLGWPAAVVADAEETHGVLDALGHGGQGRLDVLAQVLAPEGVAAGDAESGHLGAVGAPPAEEARREGLLVRAWSHEDIRIHIRLAEPSRQVGVVAERIHIVADRRRCPERAAVVGLAGRQLPRHALGRREVAVRLDDHAADRLPAARADVGDDPLEECRVQALDLLVEPPAAACEDELRVLVQAVAGAAGGRQGRVRPVRPLPEPDGVQVRVADQVHRLHDRTLLIRQSSSDRLTYPSPSGCQHKRGTGGPALQSAAGALC